MPVGKSNETTGPQHLAKGPSRNETAETYKTADRDHLVELDCLRGIAILAVVSHHMLTLWGARFGPVSIPLVGSDLLEVLHVLPGVPLFYLLSGYLLGWTEGKRARRGEYRLTSYVKRRALRLIPAYYVAIVIVLLVWPTPTSWGDLLSHLTFTQGFTPSYARTMSPAFWSLTPEIVFYALLPFTIVWLPKTWHRIFLLVALFALAVPTRFLAISYREERGASYDYGEMNPFEFYSSFPTTLLYLFVVGMLLRTMVEHLDTRPASPWRGRVSLVLFVASATYILTTPPLATLLLGGVGQTAARLGNYVLSDLTVAGFFASAVLGAPILRGILRWKPLAFVGLVSYSMFVFHQTVLLLVRMHIMSFPSLNRLVIQNPSLEWLFFLCYLLGTFGIILLVSYLGYRFIESPFLHRKPK